MTQGTERPRTTRLATGLLAACLALLPLSATDSLAATPTYFKLPPKAGDGVCVSDFSRQFPTDSNRFYSTRNVRFSTGAMYQAREAYPTAYRANFTSAVREPVWTIPAGHNHWWWTLEADIGKNPHVSLPGPPPHYTGKMADWSFYQRRDGSNYPGNMTFSRMLTDDIFDFYMPPSMEIAHTHLWRGRNAECQPPANFAPGHPDLQQYATRFVLKTPYAQDLKDFNYTMAPDIDVPDSAVLAATEENASKLTEATIERLRGYIESGNVERNYLDLNDNATIINEMSYGNLSSMTRDDLGVEQASCGLIAENPRLANVYMPNTSSGRSRIQDPFSPCHCGRTGRRSWRTRPTFWGMDTRSQN